MFHVLFRLIVVYYKSISQQYFTRLSLDFCQAAKVPKCPLKTFLSLGKRTICLLSKKQISIDLIFDLLIRDSFFSRTHSMLSGCQ
jgi:hypothetical protein